MASRLEKEWGKTAGDKDPSLGQRRTDEFVAWIDALVLKAKKAKKEMLASQLGPGRDSAEFIGQLNHYKNEEWYELFYG